MKRILLSLLLIALTAAMTPLTLLIAAAIPWMSAGFRLPTMPEPKSECKCKENLN